MIRESKILHGSWYHPFSRYGLQKGDSFIFMVLFFPDKLDMILTVGPYPLYPRLKTINIDLHNTLVPGSPASRDCVVRHIDSVLGHPYNAGLLFGFYRFTITSYYSCSADKEADVEGELVSVVGAGEVIGEIDRLGGF